MLPISPSHFNAYHRNIQYLLNVSCNKKTHLACSGIAFSDLVPVDEIKERSNVVGTSVLHINVVSMLPDIHGQDRGLSLAPGVFGIGSLRNLQFAALVSNAQPGPATTELSGTCSFESILEGIKATEIPVNGFSELSCECTKEIKIRTEC